MNAIFPKMAEVTIDGVTYGMWISYNADTGVYSVRHSERNVWKWQDYVTRNRNKMRRRVRISPVKNADTHRAVRDAVAAKYGAAK